MKNKDTLRKILFWAIKSVAKVIEFWGQLAVRTLGKGFKFSKFLEMQPFGWSKTRKTWKNFVIILAPYYFTLGYIMSILNAEPHQSAQAGLDTLIFTKTFYLSYLSLHCCNKTKVFECLWTLTCLSHHLYWTKHLYFCRQH